MTLRQIHDAAAQFGLAIDDVLDDPKRLVESEITLEEAQEFVTLILGDPVLAEMPIEQAHATLAEACSSFIQQVGMVLKRANDRMEPVWKRCGVPVGSGSTTMMRALAYSPFSDYQAMMDAPADETLVYLSLRGLNSALDK